MIKQYLKSVTFKDAYNPNKLPLKRDEFQEKKTVFVLSMQRIFKMAAPSRLKTFYINMIYSVTKY